MNAAKPSAQIITVENGFIVVITLGEAVKNYVTNTKAGVLAILEAHFDTTDGTTAPKLIN